jgi:hypothetical protein
VHNESKLSVCSVTAVRLLLLLLLLLLLASTSQALAACTLLTAARVSWRI